MYLHIFGPIPFQILLCVLTSLSKSIYSFQINSNHSFPLLTNLPNLHRFPSLFSGVVATGGSLQHNPNPTGTSLGMNINMIEDGSAMSNLSQHPNPDQMSNSFSSCSAGIISDFNFLSNLVNDYSAPPEYYQLS